MTVAVSAGRGRRENLRRVLETAAAELPWASYPRIWVKPNFVSLANPVSSTHADAVDELLAFVRERYDGPIALIEGGAGRARLAGFDRFGYRELAARHGASLEEIGEGGSKTLSVFDHRLRPMTVEADDRIVDSAFTISITPPKMHDTVVFTGALKNLIMGTLLVRELSRLRRGRRRLRIAKKAWGALWPRFAGGVPRSWRNTQAFCDVDFDLVRRFSGDDSRMSMHQSFEVMNLNLFRVTPAIHPHLSVIDAHEVMGGDGPIEGYGVEANVALAGTDYVAVDSTAARLMGLAAEDVGYLVYCACAGYGTMSPELVGDDIAPMVQRIERHTTYDQQIRWRSDAVWREVVRAC